MQLNKNLVNFLKLKKNKNLYISTGTDLNEINFYVNQIQKIEIFLKN